MNKFRDAENIILCIKEENERERAIHSERKADFGNLVLDTKRDGRETIMRGPLWK
jgi:hypothetical protein